MKDKIEVGVYVRTKNGYIDEVIITYKGKCNNPNCNEKHISCKNCYYHEEDIKKHNKNIIDLIEVGDIVEYIELTNKYKENYGTEKGRIYAQRICIKKELEEVINGIKNKEIAIKSILTHEQYEQNCFRVEIKKCDNPNPTKVKEAMGVAVLPETPPITPPIQDMQEEIIKAINKQIGIGIDIGEGYSRSGLSRKNSMMFGG